MSPIIISLFVILLKNCHAYPGHSHRLMDTFVPLRQNFNSIGYENRVDVELISNGSTYRFTNMNDGMVITVLPNGEVISDEWTGRAEQKWTLVEHPRERLALEFKQAVVPYNQLSGFEPIPGQPDIFPRPLGLNKHRIMPDAEFGRDNTLTNQDFPTPWQILIRGRWCLESHGRGRIIQMEDCEYEPAAWQYWELEEIQL